jgi:hypothetical protein
MDEPKLPEPVASVWELDLVMRQRVMAKYGPVLVQPLYLAEQMRAYGDARERAARAAALREAAEVCERMHDEHERQSRGLYDPYTAGCLDTASELADALRAAAAARGR